MTPSEAFDRNIKQREVIRVLNRKGQDNNLWMKLTGPYLESNAPTKNCTMYFRMEGLTIYFLIQAEYKVLAIYPIQ